MTLRRSSLLAALLGAALVTGCGALDTVKSVPDTVVGWFGGSGPKIADLPPYLPEAQVRRVWSADIGASGNYLLFPWLGEGRVCAASERGRVSCLDVSSGRTLWANDLKLGLSAGVGSDGRRLLVVTQDSELIALEMDGREAWRVQVAGEVLAPPRGAGSTIVLRTTDGRLLGLDADTGKRRWSYQRQLPALTIRNQAGAVIDSGVVYAGWPGGKLTALTLDRGALLWEATVAIPRGTTELERIADVISNPVIDADRICASAFQGRTVCFERERGQVVWARDIPSNNSPAFDFRRAYVVDEKGSVHGLQRSSGVTDWTQDGLRGRYPGGSLSYGDYVWVGDVEGYIHLLDRANGKLFGRHATDGSQVLLPPLQTPSGVLVSTRKGQLQMLTASERP